MEQGKESLQDALAPQDAAMPVVEVAAESLPDTLKDEPGCAESAPAKKESVFAGYVSPILKMLIICMVTSFLLALTNNLTITRIEANAAAETNAAMQELLPDADSFEEVPVTVEAPNVISMYKAANGAGYVVTAFGQGYGGRVPAMVAFGPDGSISGVKFLANSETPGLGNKVSTEPAFAEQFAGLPAQQLALADIDAFTGATISSKAALKAVNAATALYEEQVGSQTVDTAVNATPEEGGK